jgi:hypothetical protein
MNEFESSFQSILFSYVFVYDESLTRMAFLDKVMLVRSVELLFIELIQTKIRETEQTQEAVSSPNSSFPEQ